MSTEKLETIKVFYSVNNCGDGSASLSWYPTEKEAIEAQESASEYWSELCYGSVETFIGSNIHKSSINVRDNVKSRIPEKINIFYSINDCGDGSAGVTWYLTEEEAINEQETMDPSWGEPCYGLVETFIGSDIHNEAVRNK